MTALCPSSSSAQPPSSAFGRLHPRVQRWIYEQNWTELRDIQESAALPILGGETDVIIAAATAGGKTEAAFLPICSRLVDSARGSVRVLYLSPLKALINDQYDRLERLCDHLEIPVNRWHGDVNATSKKHLLQDPRGILLITPESLEALFVVHGTRIPTVFAQLEYVVVDELHSFIGTERGRQLQSLLHRVELAIQRQVARIALSATLGDMYLAADFLRPGQGERVELIASAHGGGELRLQLRGYRIADPANAEKRMRAGGHRGGQLASQQPPGGVAGATGDREGDKLAIAEDLYVRLRGADNLIFVNSRSNVEAYADLLRRLCERRRVPNEFWAHHGNLAKDLREDVETMLKERNRPISVVCTTTLEMGIDIGDMASIAQIGAPPSVSSLRQRLGRSGRRGGPAVMRIYIQERDLTADVPPQDALRAELVQTVGMVNLLLGGWYEPPTHGALHLSTLVQQVLSLIAQHGGVRPIEAWRALCQGGAFRFVDERMFAKFLRSLGEHDLVVQSPDGTLLLGIRGERTVGHYSFFTAFMTPDEYRLVAEGRTLGTIPIDFPVGEGTYLIFAGRRWRVVSVDAEHRVIDLVPSVGGLVPRFTGSGGGVHDRVRQEMLRIYTSEDVPTFLDTTARDLLLEGREHFARFGLGRRSLIEHGGDTLLFCWMGDRVMDTLLVILRQRGLKVQRDGLALTIESRSRVEVAEHLRSIISTPPVDARALAVTVANKRTEKYHAFLTEELLSADYASQRLNPEGAWTSMQRILPHEML